MKNVKVCPKCGNLVYFNSYFGAFICESCEWEDASYAKRRDAYLYSLYNYRKNNSMQGKAVIKNR